MDNLTPQCYSQSDSNIGENYVPDYSYLLNKQVDECKGFGDLDKVAFLQVLANYAPCVTDSKENKRLSTQEIRDIALPVVSLKADVITKLMVATGFKISLDSQQVAAWDIQRLSTPIEISMED